MKDYRFCPHCRTELVTRTRGDRPRRVCPAEDCRFVHWDNPVPVAAAIVERDDGVVLVRSRSAPATWFGLVAGFIEPGEQPLEAALREVREEIGLEPREPVFIETTPFAARNQLLFTWHVRVPMDAIRLCEVELAEYRIVPPERLIPWNRGTGPALRAWLAARGFTPEPVDFGAHIEL
jgi:NAD+ diphosphatase